MRDKYYVAENAWDDPLFTHNDRYAVTMWAIDYNAAHKNKVSVYY